MVKPEKEEFIEIVVPAFGTKYFIEIKVELEDQINRLWTDITYSLYWNVVKGKIIIDVFDNLGSNFGTL